MKRLILILLLAFTPTALADTLGGGIFNVSAGKAKDAVFANLGAPLEGNFRFCPDCQPTSPCTSGGTGAFAYRINTTWNCNVGSAGSGDVAGPASSTDNAIVRFDSTTGKSIQNSQTTVDDTGTINIPLGETINWPGGRLMHSDSLGLQIEDNNNGSIWRLNTQSVTGTKTVTLPNTTGTLALTSSNVATATALAANPTDCSANQFATAIAASGNLTCATVGAVTNLAVSTGVTNGTGMQHVRIASCTTGAVAEAACDTAVTWPIAFADTSYTVVVTLDSPTGGSVFLTTKNKTATSIDVTLVNLSAAASDGIINIIAMHD